MNQHTIVANCLSAGVLPELRHSASSKCSVLALDTVQISAVAAPDPQHLFLVPVLRFETFMAESARVEDFDEGDFIARATVDVAKMIAFFEEFPTQVKIIDIELMSELLASGDVSPAPQIPGLEHLEADIRAAVFPSAIDRLLWMERRSDFGGEVARTFDTLEACTIGLPSLNSECSRAERQGGSLGRRHALLSQIQGDLVGTEVAEQLGTELVRLREENTRLQQRLEEATLSQEISDLMIMQLQEELELLLPEHLSGGEDPRKAATASSVEVDPVSAPSEKETPKRPRHAIKRWVSAMFITPSTRAQIKLLKASELFDPDWYCAIYTDVANSSMTPEHHFLRFGAREYRDPSPKFSTQRYLWQHSEIDVAEVNPLVHFLQSGSG